MSTRANNKKGNSAAQPTLSGQDAEESQVSDAAPPDMDSQKEENVIKRLRYPCTIIDYRTYQTDLVTLARYVDPKSFSALGNPERNPLPPTAELRRQYVLKCPYMEAFLDEEIDEVCVTFERWSVPPDRLREEPLHPDLSFYYGVGRMGPSEPEHLYGYSYLEWLYRILESLGKQWVSEKAEEPATFWRSHICQSFQLPNSRGY